MKRKRLLIGLVALLLLSAAAPAALAAQGLHLDRWTVDGGGGNSQSSGGQYTLSGAAGQAEAGGPAEGGSYSLQSGFWTDGEARYTVYLPTVVRKY
jgi:hypothetical protein